MQFSGPPFWSRSNGMCATRLSLAPSQETLRAYSIKEFCRGLMPDKEQEPSRESIERQEIKEDAERLAGDLRLFIPEAWKVLHPESELIPNWHIDGLAETLMSWLRGDFKKLAISIPPGFLKSTICSVILGAWKWASDPWFQFLYASYDDDLSIRDSVACRGLIRSHWYQSRWGDKVRMKKDQNQKTEFATERGGLRICTTIGGKATGLHVHAALVDDPFNVQKVNKQDLERVEKWWFGAMPTRGHKPEEYLRAVIHQRVKEDDLIGVW